MLQNNKYSPFGMIMPRVDDPGNGKFGNLNTGDYRFGFNGMEMDNEVSGNGNMYDYGFRIYNPRLGRFLSTDPLFMEYPFFTPYQFAANTPIQALDLDGLEILDYRTIFRAKVYRTEIGLGYALEIEDILQSPNHEWQKTKETFEKLESAMGDKNLNIRASNMVGEGTFVIEDPPIDPNDPVPTESSSNHGEIRDVVKDAIFEKMGKRTEPEQSTWWEFTGNPKPGAANAVAFTIESLSKWAFTKSPMFTTELANQDFVNMSDAYEQAFFGIVDHSPALLKRIEGTGWDGEQYLSALMNYIVDNKLPNTNNQAFNKDIKAVGDVFTSNPKFSQKKRLQTE